MELQGQQAALQQKHSKSSPTKKKGGVTGYLKMLLGQVYTLEETLQKMIMVGFFSVFSVMWFQCARTKYYL